MELWGMVWDPNGEGWESSDCRLLQTTGGRWSARFAENQTDPHPTMEGALEALLGAPIVVLGITY